MISWVEGQLVRVGRLACGSGLPGDRARTSLRRWQSCDWSGRDNRHRIAIHRLSAYSPEFMAMEGIWKPTRKLTAHNAFFVTPDQRDARLTKTFQVFQRRPEVIAAQVARFAMINSQEIMFRPALPFGRILQGRNSHTWTASSTVSSMAFHRRDPSIYLSRDPEAGL